MGIKKITENRQSAKDNPEIAWEIMKRMEEKQGFTTEPSKGGRFFPSNFGNACDRFLWLHYHGKLKGGEINAQVSRIFNIGNSAEARYLQYFLKAGLMKGDKYGTHREITCKITVHGAPVSGRADFLLDYNGTPYIIELKTIKKADFDKLLAPKKDHATQIQFYLNILNIERGAVLYECKDNQQIKIFEVIRSDGFWKSVEARIAKIMAMKSPPKMAEVAARHDKYCDCRNVPDDELIFFDEDIV